MFGFIRTPPYIDFIGAFYLGGGHYGDVGDDDSGDDDGR